MRIFLLLFILTMIVSYMQPGFTSCMDDLCIEDICDNTACTCAKCQLFSNTSGCSLLKSLHLTCLPERLNLFDKIADYATCPIDIDHPPRVV